MNSEEKKYDECFLVKRVVTVSVAFGKWIAENATLDRNNAPFFWKVKRDNAGISVYEYMDTLELFDMYMESLPNSDMNPEECDANTLNSNSKA